jgi:hypothetical protein
VPHVQASQGERQDCQPKVWLTAKGKFEGH